MKKKFMFAKPGKKRFVSLNFNRPTELGLRFNSSQNIKEEVKVSTKGSNLQNQPENPKKKNRILGTADYMAPEVIKGQDVNYLLDFWSLGIIAYEFFTGNLPFNDDSPKKIFQNILNKEIDWPEAGDDDYQINPVALDFLQKLLVRDPKSRLGAKRGI